MISPIIPFVIFIIADIVPIRTDAFSKSISDCDFDRPIFGQIQHVELSSISISLHLKNHSSHLRCSAIRIDVFLVKTQTNQLDRILENVPNRLIFLDQLDSNKNYSITIQISDSKKSRILPTHVFQTLPSFDLSTLTLAENELLTIEQIESQILPHTHIYIVTVPVNLHRSIIHGQVTLSYTSREGKLVDYRQIVKSLDQNSVSRLGRASRNTILFSLELPFENANSIEYSSSLQLYFPNDQRQSIFYRSGIFQSLLPMTVEFLSLTTGQDSGRSSRVSISHLCPMYLEVKAIVYDDFFTKKIISRNQCDINKNHTTLTDITNGRCSMIMTNLQPEHNYTLAIRATCPLTSAISSRSSYVFYDRTRLFSFQTATGSPDYFPLNISFDIQKKILSWTVANTKMGESFDPYLGVDHYYELLARSNDNWTLIYRGNQTNYQITSELLKTTNVSFQIYIGNRYSRHTNQSGEIHLNLQPQSSFNNHYQMIILIVFIAILLVFALLFVGYCVRNKTFYDKLKQKYYRNDPMSDKELEHLRSLAHSNILKENILYTWNHAPTNTDLEKLPKIERAAIKLDHLLGKGAFGEVYAGRLNQNRQIAVKTLLSSASDSQRLDFLKEAIIMNQFNHHHIVHLLGVCFHHDQQPQFLILELMDKGDLQNYIRHSRPNQEREQCLLSYEDCLDIARQIADGACYLEQHAYVHRDLAARNCLVSSSDKVDGKVLVKIGDFGLARLLSEQDYYRKTGEALLPVRWMAPESLLDAIFTSNSDIWSFGIVLWEIITLGQVPYSPLNNQQVISLITTTRGTLEKPSQCTQALYEIMLLCWNYVPEKRIHFDEIRSHLDDLLSNPEKEQPSTWFAYDMTSSAARTVLDSVLSHIEPPASISLEGSDTGECRSSTSGCFSSMTESSSPAYHHGNAHLPYQLRLIDDTTSNDFADEDYHSDIMKRSLQ